MSRGALEQHYLSAVLNDLRAAMTQTECKRSRVRLGKALKIVSQVQQDDLYELQKKLAKADGVLQGD